MDWWGNLNACVEAVTAWGSLSLQSCIPGLGGELINIEDRRFRIVKLLGEGGYSFVFLVREVPTAERPHVSKKQFALKKVPAASGDQMALASKEIEVMKQLNHKNLLPLLASCVTPTDQRGSLRYTVYMLFPLYEIGTVVDEMERRQQRNSPFTTKEILQIFLQICKGVQAMHHQQPPLAHRDIKPHNILLQPIEPTTPSTQRFEYSQLQQHGEGSTTVNSLFEDNGYSFHAVLMDFGSTKPARMEVHNRMEALRLQEDAEAHCTAPYRAPELFDVPSQCTVDERIDIWSLGCTLYYMMYGVSPFEKVLNEAGGSLALAIVNGRVSWPTQDQHPAELRQLVELCMNVDPQTRPYIEDVIVQVRQMRQQFG